jgi:Fur family peroxide stress response transcriptional regulator
MANVHRYRADLISLTETGHRTAEELFKELKKTYFFVGIGSVYRNLTELVEENILMKTAGLKDKVIYEKYKHPHGHLVCHASGTILDVDSSLIDTSTIKIPDGFALEDVQIILHGHFLSEQACKIAVQVAHEHCKEV